MPKHVERNLLNALPFSPRAQMKSGRYFHVALRNIRTPQAPVHQRTYYTLLADSRTGEPAPL